MIRRSWAIWLPMAALLSFAPPAVGQETPETGQSAPETETPAVDAEVPATAPSRQEWVILMAILGEQLPSGSTLMAINVDTRGAIVLEVAGTTQVDLVDALTPYFTTVQTAPQSNGRSTAKVQGVPASLGQYRSLKRTGPNDPDAQQPPQPTPPAVAPQANGPIWPPLRVRRVFDQDDTRMVQLTLDGRDYIVREGGLFSNNAYRFVEMAPGQDGQPSAECVTLERVATADREDLCIE